jgi:hypothetical protein
VKHGEKVKAGAKDIGDRERWKQKDIELLERNESIKIRRKLRKKRQHRGEKKKGEKERENKRER